MSPEPNTGSRADFFSGLLGEPVLIQRLGLTSAEELGKVHHGPGAAS